MRLVPLLAVVLVACSTPAPTSEQTNAVQTPPIAGGSQPSFDPHHYYDYDDFRRYECVTNMAEICTNYFEFDHHITIRSSSVEYRCHGIPWGWDIQASLEILSKDGDQTNVRMKLNDKNLVGEMGDPVEDAAFVVDEPAVLTHTENGLDFDGPGVCKYSVEDKKVNGRRVFPRVHLTLVSEPFVEALRRGSSHLLPAGKCPRLMNAQPPKKGEPCLFSSVGSDVHP
ncbi:MAG: hypothetical protein HY903_06920 [Deltaproteobacteria bacterium]|nr:hypothetical protein [Deltaproteobacteria bacterium]